MTSLLEMKTSKKTKMPDTSPKTSDPFPKTSDPSSKEKEQTPDRSMVLHFWKEREEDLLVFLRHDRSDGFGTTRNHTALWKEIVKELAKIKFNVTAQQAFNKYAALKKKWKEIIDALSGPEARYFRHKTAFDNEYGNKASTKPVYTLDTDAKDKDVSEYTVNPTKSKKTRKVFKRRSEEMISVMKEQHTEIKEELRHQHADKMNRMDRMLDLYQRDVAQASLNKKQK